jgi:hypothetical protein
MLDDDYSEGDNGDDGEDGNADDDSDDSGDNFVTPKRNKQLAKRTRKKRKTTINRCGVVAAKAHTFTGKQRKQPWRVLQSLAAAQRGRCVRVKCPRLTKSQAKVKHSYKMLMRCEECSARMGCNIFFVQRHKERRPGVLPHRLPQAAP